MANYRFKTAEIEAMKKNIITQIEHETETKTAWRLRCAIEGQLMCCRPSKREAARLERELALYESLTKNDLPNWQTEAAQAAQATETPQISTQTGEAVNVSVEGEKGTERADNKPYYTHRWRVLHNCDLKTWDKFYKKHKEAILIFHHDTTYTALQKQAVKVSEMCDIAYKVNCHGVEVCQFNDATLTQIIEQGIHVAIAELPEAPDYGLTEPPQSPETPQVIECTTDTPKPRETARKRPNRAIGSAQHHQYSALGANGYAVLNNASATLTAMYVPRECSTADAANWQSRPKSLHWSHQTNFKTFQ